MSTLSLNFGCKTHTIFLHFCWRFLIPLPFSDSHYASMRADLETDAQDLEAESWSLTVEQDYVKKHSKETVKRQDVIYGKFRFFIMGCVLVPSVREIEQLVGC